MVILQKESKIELLGSKVCRSWSNKIKLREGGGVTNRKASLLSVWGKATKFWSFKMCNSNFVTALQQLSLQTVSYYYYFYHVNSKFRTSLRLTLRLTRYCLHMEGKSSTQRVRFSTFNCLLNMSDRVSGSSGLVIFFDQIVALLP